MQIVERELKELIPYENNPRHNENAVEAVANSIREFGFKVPVIVDKNDVIVCGHTRVKAAERLGMRTVPVISADDLTDEQIKAFRLADNKTAELAEWDLSMLDAELAELQGFEMSRFGFEDIEEPNPSEIDREIENKNPVTIRIIFDKKADMQKVEADLRECLDSIDGVRVSVSGGIVGDADEVDDCNT